MNKTKIDWADYTINPIKGLCKYACPYCYARRMYKRYKWNEDVRLELSELNKLDTIKEPSRIFVCSTHDLFGEWIPDKWVFDIITKCQTYPQHTFILLTKNPKRYVDFLFRKNFWLGMTMTKTDNKADWDYHSFTGMDNLVFLSIEPLINEMNLDMILNIYRRPDWIICGGLTPKPAHKTEWVEDIIEYSAEHNIPLFLKNNLKYKNLNIQEFPKHSISKVVNKFRGVR